MTNHVYLESGWCICGYHRDDGRQERDTVPLLARSEIRQTLDQHRTKADTK